MGSDKKENQEIEGQRKEQFLFSLAPSLTGISIEELPRHIYYGSPERVAFVVSVADEILIWLFASNQPRHDQQIGYLRLRQTEYLTFFTGIGL